MKIVAVKCPSCGAKVRVGDSDRLKCEYCGTESVIQRREGLLERAVKVQAPEGMPVAVQTHSFFWIFFTMFIVVALIAIPITALLWETFELRFMSQPVLVDLNADGALDVVGIGDYRDGDTVLVAYDGATGDRLWRTDVLGAAEVKQGVATVVGDKVLLVSKAGEVDAFDAATGEAAWAGKSLGEKVRTVCEPGEGVARLWMADRTMRSVSLSDGTIERRPETDECRSIGSTRHAVSPGTQRIDETLTIGSMHSEILTRLNGSTTWVATGYKAKGTGTWKLARVEYDGVLDRTVTEIPAPQWEVDAAGSDPLEVSGRDFEHVALSRDAVFIGYEYDDERPTHVSAVAVRDGARRWDVELRRDSDVSGLVYGTGRVFVYQSLTLTVLDAGSGAVLFEVGL